MYILSILIVEAKLPWSTERCLEIVNVQKWLDQYQGFIEFSSMSSPRTEIGWRDSGAIEAKSYSNEKALLGSGTEERKCQEAQRGKRK
jgi:hypothetical protein